MIDVCAALLPALFDKLVQHDLIDCPVDTVVDPLPDIFRHTAVARIYPPPAPLTLLTSPAFFSMAMSCSR